MDFVTVPTLGGRVLFVLLLSHRSDRSASKMMGSDCLSLCRGSACRADERG